MTVPNRLRHLRNLLKYTQQQVAWNARITQGYYQRVERGDSMPTIPVARQIARALDSDVDTCWPERASKGAVK